MFANCRLQERFADVNRRVLDVFTGAAAQLTQFHFKSFSLQFSLTSQGILVPEGEECVNIRFGRIQYAHK